MAVMKKSTRKKLSKQLNKLIKRHGPEMALALVTGIVGALASDRAADPPKKVKRSKAVKLEKAPKEGKPGRALAKAPAGLPVKSPARTIVIRKRA